MITSVVHTEVKKFKCNESKKDSGGGKLAGVTRSNYESHRIVLSDYLHC